jgi:hypothetical protein
MKNSNFQSSFADNRNYSQGKILKNDFGNALTVDNRQNNIMFSNKEESTKNLKANKLISTPNNMVEQQKTTIIKKEKANDKPKKSYGQLARQMKCKQVIVAQLEPSPINFNKKPFSQKPPYKKGKQLPLRESAKEHVSSKKHTNQRNPFKESPIHSGWKIERRISPLSKSSSTNQGSIMQISNSRNIQSTSLRSQEKSQEEQKNAEQTAKTIVTRHNKNKNDKNSSEGSVESSHSRNSSLFKNKLNSNKSKDSQKDSEQDSVYRATRKKIKSKKLLGEMQTSFRVRTPSYAEKKRVWAGENGVFSKNRLTQWYSSFQE